MKEKQIKEYLEKNYNIKFVVDTLEFNHYLIIFCIGEKSIKIDYIYRNEHDEIYNNEMISMYVDYDILKCFKK